jgi:hypothetical protein
MLGFPFPCFCLSGEHGGFVVVHGDREAAPEVGVLDHSDADWIGSLKQIWTVEGMFVVVMLRFAEEKVGRTVRRGAVD